MQKKKRFKRGFLIDDSGVTMIWALILFLMVTILTSSALFLSRQDTLEAVNQENRIRAYYVALSGVDLGYAALMADQGGAPYIETFAADDTKTITDTISIPNASNPIGTATVTIDSVTIDEDVWVRITSVGSLNDSPMSATSIMRINPDNLDHIVRESITN